jgi:parallel beta-helix repeat protein
MPRMRRLIALFAASISICAQESQPLPHVVLSQDDTEIRESCVIDIPPGYIVADRNTNGVIRIAADDIKVRFIGELRGATNGTPWDTLRGIGIRIDNHKNVTIENAKIRGFKNGILATGADGLVVTDCDFADNYRQHLKSTREGENGDDWLFPHHNDKRKWHDEYGGAICIENATNVVVRRVIVRRGQNGILLDRVNDSAFYDNDCSFLSGWGIALWMSNGNKITRNAFDFCIRGHFEDVYNRGQDSAGILCFEQSSDNLFAENSVTHGGDGFFGFAGHNAIGESWWNHERERLRAETGKQEVDDLIKPTPELSRLLSDRGCNRNILIGNDFSYAAAHGIELTFSEDNTIARNRIVENAICGYWGGYSSRALIVENDFERNGGMGYGLERGAINIEHGADNLILKNDFVNNKCAIHLWWDNDGVLMRYPGVAGNNRGVVGNVIAKNHFEVNGDIDFKRTNPNSRFVMLQIRDDSKTHVHDNAYFGNDVKLKHPLAVEFALADDIEIARQGDFPKYKLDKYEPLGTSHPVGARRQLRGRRFIVMDEWGPKEY